MPHATLSLAPHVGSFVAATDVSGGALLAIVLAAGSRGEHRVSVLDARDYSLVASFPIPSRAKSGITPIQSDEDVLIANDDHTLVAFDPRSGTRLWERAFPAPRRLRLVDVRRGRVLVSIEDEGHRLETWLLRARDGADDAHMRFVDIVRSGTETRRIPLNTRRFGAVDAAELDETGARLVIGTRAAEVLVLDIATGVASTVLEMEDPVRCVGFHRGAPWAMDAKARLRILGEPPTALDLGLSTYGGLLADDGSTMALSDLDTRGFRVRRLPSNEELFATIPGFACEAVGVDAEGALLVSSADNLLRVDGGTGKIAKLGAGARELVRLPNGTLALVGASVRALAPGASKPAVLARSADDVAFAGDGSVLVATSGRVVEVWDVASAKRTWRIDLDRTWVALRSRRRFATAPSIEHETRRAYAGGRK
jgi:hypothetical protein